MAAREVLTNIANRAHLEKARSIAELRSPSRDDGTIARIIWMQANVMREDVLSAGAADQLRIRAEVALNNLTEKGEATPLTQYDKEGNVVVPDEETLYDALVPGYFR
jgi:hypothetical protein